MNTKTIGFPSDPFDGQVYEGWKWDGVKWEWNVTGGSGGGSIQDGDTEGQITTWDGTEWTPESNVVVDANGNAGIGTDTPLRKLHISEDSGSAFLQVTTKDDSSSGGILMGSSSNPTVGQVFYEHASDSMRLVTSGEERMTIDAAGNVGIGTGDPARILHVERDGQADLMLRDTSSYSLGTGPAVIFQGKDTREANVQFGAIYGVANGSNSGELTFETRNSGSSEERMRIDASGDLILSHPAGIYGRRSSGDLALKLIGYVPGTDDVELVATNKWILKNGSGAELLKADSSGRVDITGSLYVNGTPKIGTVDMIKAFSKLRDAVKDEDTVESLRESITNCIGGLIEEWESMQSAAMPAPEAGE